MLKVTGLNAYYDRSHVVQDIGFEVAQGEIVTLMGRNGAGKTTTLRTLMGLLGKRSGSMVFDGQECLMQPPHTPVSTWAWPTFPRTAASCLA
jgi:branched-chain amino acid transport system ATP-binding protein